MKRDGVEHTALWFKVYSRENVVLISLTHYTAEENALEAYIRN